MSPRTYKTAGFTLIEILVVVLVVSILMGVVVSSFTGVDQEQSFRGYAERLSLRIEMARDKALQANREWGVYLDRDGVRFAEFDEINGEWIVRTDKPFNGERYDTSVEFRVKVEALAGTLPTGEDEDNPLPDIVLFSSGEVTPFEISIQPLEWQTRAWRLSSDGFTRTTLEREDSV